MTRTPRRSGLLNDAARLALGTLTVLPVRPPGRVDRRVAAWAMTLGPLVGGLLAAVCGTALWLLALVGAPGFLAAALVAGLLAVLTRGMHLDGLADTADGLGSGRPAERALEVMRRGDVGPFGVVTLVLTLLVQVAALGALVAAGPAVPGGPAVPDGPAVPGGAGAMTGPVALATALVVSRLVLPLLCSRGVPAARSDGLGHVVAGSVGRGSLAVAAALTVGVLVVPLLRAGAPALWSAVVAAALGMLAATALARRAVRRLGGITGDVLGAAVEVAFTTVLVVLVLLGGL